MNDQGLIAKLDQAHYQWRDDLNLADYILAIYEVAVTCDSQLTAIAIAMAQSVGGGQADDSFDAGPFAGSSARVVQVSELSDQTATLFTEAQSPVQDDVVTTTEVKRLLIELAVPLRRFARKPAQLFNVLVGTLPRVGLLRRCRLVSANLPADFGPGAGFGLDGLRLLAQQAIDPLLCRSMRPAVGLDAPTLVQRSFDALVSGAQIVKDDELAVFANFAEFKQHIRGMISARDAARAETGGQKLYLANLICEPWELSQRWELCCYLGVDGVFIAPWLQGWGTLSYLARLRKMPILAEDVLGELFTQHSDGAVDHSVLNHWLQILGADFYYTGGQSESHQLAGELPADQLQEANGMNRLVPAVKKTIPVLRGANNPYNLAQCREQIGSDDFMLIFEH